MRLNQSLTDLRRTPSLLAVRTARTAAAVEARYADALSAYPDVVVVGFCSISSVVLCTRQLLSTFSYSSFHI